MTRSPAARFLKREPVAVVVLFGLAISVALVITGFVLNSTTDQTGDGGANIGAGLLLLAGIAGVVGFGVATIAGALLARSRTHRRPHS